MKTMILMMMLLLFSCTKDAVYRKNITTAGEKQKICFIGDTGTGKEVQQKVADMLMKENCHSIHFVGDIIYPHGLRSPYDPQFEKKFMNYYKDISNSGNKPILYMIMGNHDHRNSISHWITLSRKHKEIFFPNPYYLVRSNDVCMVHVDTDYLKFASNFFVRIEQNNWLKKIQNDLQSCKTKIAVTHHPYKSSGDKHGHSSGAIKKFHERWFIGKFDYIISGHEHFLSDEGVENGTRLLISGAGGNTTKIEDGGYLVLEAQNGNVTYKFRKLSE